MGNRLIDDLRNEGVLAGYWNLRSGSLLDLSGNGHAASVTGTPAWRRTQGRTGLYVPNAGSSYASVGNPVGLQLGVGTIFAAAARTETSATYNGIFVKVNAYSLFFAPTAEPKAFGCYNWAGGMVSSTFTENPTGLLHLFAMSFQSGVPGGVAFYVDGSPCGTGALTVTNQTQPLNIGWNSADTGFGGTVHMAGVASRVLTGPEHARLFDDFLAEGLSPDLPRRNFVYYNQGHEDWWYNSQGIILDTDYRRQSDGAVEDLTGNHPGAVYGVATPGPNGEGLYFATNNDGVTWGDTFLNSVGAFYLEYDCELPYATDIGGNRGFKYQDVNNNISVNLNGGASITQPVVFYVSTGGTAYGVSPTAQLRGGTRQHMMCVFNGSGVGNPGRMQMYVDGEAVPLSFFGTIPATTWNGAGFNWRSPYIGGGGARGIYRAMRIGLTAPTAAQARAAYLKNFAQKLLLKETFEDVPVSLVASVGVGVQIGSWTVVSGTWKVSESSDGKRWLECVSAGIVAMRYTDAFGTLVFTRRAGAATSLCMIQASLPAALATANQNGYAFYSSIGANELYLARVTNGIVALALMLTAAGYTAANTQYTFAITRRPSDGRFTTYIKGGAFVNWTLVASAGGGSNPTAGETSTTTSSYFTCQFVAGDKLLLFDPQNAGAGLFAFQGPLDPTVGEIPGQ